MVSIIVPVYNCEKYLNECIESILGQTYKDIELILVNDGSVDNSPKICCEIVEQDSRVKYISQKNQGPSKARNVGIDNANGEYIMFVDSDDYINIDTIQKCMDKNKSYDADVICFDYSKVSGKNKRNYKLFNEDERIFCGNQIEYLRNLAYASEQETEKDILALTGICCKLYKKETIGTIRFDEKLKLGEDCIFIINVLKSISKFIYLGQCFYNRRVVENSLSNCCSKDYVDRRIVLANKMIDIAEVEHQYINRYCFNSLCSVACVIMNDRNISFKNKKEELNRFLKGLKNDFKVEDVSYKCRNKNYQLIRFFIKYKMYILLIVLMRLIEFRDKIKTC